MIMSRGSVGALVAAAVLCVAAEAHAKCTKDSECKGDRICTKGVCVAPSAEAAPEEPPPIAPPAQPPPPPTHVVVPVAPAYPGYSYGAPPPPLSTHRRSKGMMIGGIVMTSVGIVTFVAAAALLASGDSSDQRAGAGTALLTVALLGAGIPLWIIGKREVPDTDPAQGAQPQAWSPSVFVGKNTVGLGFAF